jgi:hypothetical protein
MARPLRGWRTATALCLFSILQMEVDLTIVAALLTLIAYAVNDTVSPSTACARTCASASACRSTS